MMFCQRCNDNVREQTDLGHAPGNDGLTASRKLVPIHLCPKCESFLGLVEQAQPAKPAEPADATNVVPIRAPQKPAPIKRSDVSIVDQCRTRLAELDTEIARIAALKKEARQLRAMLRAAEVNQCK